MEDNKKKKRVFLLVIIFLIIILTLVLTTVILYTNKVKNNRASDITKSTTINIKEIVYDSSKPLILMNALPGDSTTSTIIVYNPNTKMNASYEIKLVIDKNEFVNTEGNNQLTIKIKSKTTGEEKIFDLTDSLNTNDKSLFTVKELGPKKSHLYDVKLSFQDTNSSQDSNINKKFIGHIELVQAFELLKM